MASGVPAATKRKIAVMGYPCVGKSSITLQFVSGLFPDAYDTTVEDMHMKTMRFHGKEYKLQITDTAGQQEYSLIPRSCAVDIDGYILVYAIDDRKSEYTPLVVVGNKVDLEHSSRNIPREEGQRLATSWKAAFLETSAKDKNAVVKIFECMLMEIERGKGNFPLQRTSNAQNKGSCCIA